MDTHENHTPTGALKLRGGLNLLAQLARDAGLAGVVSATRGNHSQSLAFAARRHGVRCRIVVPQGNSRDKNAAMRAFDAELTVHGRDFDEARVHAAALAAAEGLRFVGPFEPALVTGVATYALELFRAASDLHTVFVPIGCGSGICGLIAARDALGLRIRIVGVVSSTANAYAQSFARRERIETPSVDTIADGMAVRVLNGRRAPGLERGPTSPNCPRRRTTLAAKQSSIRPFEYCDADFKRLHQENARSREPARASAQSVILCNTPAFMITGSAAPFLARMRTSSRGSPSTTRMSA